MAKVEKHPTEEDKYQCPLCSYGHEKAKSRQAVYKHHKTAHSEPVDEVIEEITDYFDLPDSELKEDDTFDDEWSSISWMKPDEVDEVTPHTIPDPIKKMAGSDGQHLLQAHRTMSRSMIRWSFLGLDRLITWWGRGVTNDPNYKLQRSNQDYDVLQNSTITMLDAYGIQIPSSPILVWTTIVGSAYVPPIMAIQAKADPSKRGVFRAILMRLPIIGKRLRKKQKAEVIVAEEIE